VVERPGAVPLPRTRPDRSRLFLYVSLRLDPLGFTHSANTVLTPGGKSFSSPCYQRMNPRLCSADGPHEWSPLAVRRHTLLIGVAAVFRVLCGVVSQKQDTTCPQIKRGSTTPSSHATETIHEYDHHQRWYAALLQRLGARMRCEVRYFCPSTSFLLEMGTQKIRNNLSRIQVGQNMEKE
jgi:hypothetical protein